MVAGVALGLAERLDLPPWLIRVAFVVLTFSGGFGIALYAAGWLLIPEEGADEPIASSLFGRAGSVAAWIGVALIALAVLIFTESVGFVRGDLVVAAILITIGVLLFRGDLGRAETRERKNVSEHTGDSPPPPRPVSPPQPPSVLGRVTFGLTVLGIGIMAMAEYLSAEFDPSARHYLGLALGIVGLGLLVGAFVGRARGLIVLGVFLIPALLISTVADVTFATSVGERVHNPQRIEAIQPEYKLGVGSLVIDLSDVTFTGEEVDIEADVGVGELRIYVPRDVAVHVTGKVGIGEFDALGYNRDGVVVSFDHAIDGTQGRINLDTRVNIGQIRVIQGSPSSLSPRLGDIVYEVDSVEELRSSYSLASGTMVIDLSDLELDAQRSVNAHVGTGKLRIVVPEDITTRVVGEVGVGKIDIAGREQRGGLGLESTYVSGTGAVLLEIRAEVGAGDLIVEGAK